MSFRQWRTLTSRTVHGRIGACSASFYCIRIAQLSPSKVLRCKPFNTFILSIYPKRQQFVPLPVQNLSFSTTRSKMGDRQAVIFDKSDLGSPAHYKASQTAVLLLDFHNLFVQKVGGAKAQSAAQQAVKLRKWAQDQGILVVHGLVDVHQKPFPTCKDAARMASIVQTLEGDPKSSEEPDELKGDSTKEPVLLRTPGHVSVLKSPGFDELMTSRGIKSLVMCGLSTSGCVTRSAFSATDAEYVVTVIADACADPTEGLHETLVEKVLPSRGHCCSLDHFIAEWEKTKGR